MADVKWIKITTDMFDNRKIKHLRRLPDGNNIVLIWVMLLTMAGRCNSGGMIFLTENIPYTPKMLADELDFEENTVQLALGALEQLGMIVTNNGFFSITGWEEYQNIDGLEKIREQNRIRQKKFYDKKKELPNVSSNVSITQPNATEEDIEEEIEKEGDIKDIIPDSAEPEPPAPKKTKPEKPVKHKYGEYKNVFLSDDELEKLKAEYPDYLDRIERLSSYVESTGKKYKSHYATIRNWARKDAEKPGRKEIVPSWMNKKNQFNNFPERDAENMDDLEAALLGTPKTAANDEELRRRVQVLKEKIGGA